MRDQNQSGEWFALLVTAIVVAALSANAILIRFRQTESAPGGAPTRIHYAPEENLEAIDADLISRAKTTIDIAAYALTDGPVLAALDRAAMAGVRVRLYLDKAVRNGTTAPALQMTHLAALPSVQWKYKTARALMHLKSYCVDGATLRTGSANFSPSGERRQDNDLVVVEGPGACAAFATHFETMWSREP